MRADLLAIRKTRRYFDGMAQRWDAITAIDAGQDRTIRAGLESLGIAPGETVVDAGCGTGVLFPYLLSMVGPQGILIGVDVSPSMVEQARSKYRGKPNVRLVASEILRFLQCCDCSIADRIICFSAFPHFPKKRFVIAEFARILRPAGRFGLLHLSGSECVNAFHAELAGTPVQFHALPPVSRVEQMALDAGFRSLKAIDREDLYLFVAEK